MPAASYEVQVRYSETGAQGFVYHANYYSWYELVQYEFLRNRGYSFEDLESSGVLFTITDIRTKFYAPAKFGDRLKIDMYVDDVNKIRMNVRFIITRISDSVKIAESTAVYACVNGNFKPLLLERAIPELYEQIRAECPKAE